MRSGPKWILMLALCLAPRVTHAYDALDLLNDMGPTLEDATVCGNETSSCRKMSCLELCLADGEDPMECPSVCILTARKGSPAERYNLNFAIAEAKAAPTLKQLCQVSPYELAGVLR